MLGFSQKVLNGVRVTVARNMTARMSSPTLFRKFSDEAADNFDVNKEPARKVAVVGAAGGIGQPLSLLLKLNHRVSELSLYDVAPVIPGVGVDLSHCNSRAVAKGYPGDAMHEALKDADVVVIPAGVPRKPGMTRDDLFKVNAGINMNVAKVISEACPKACICVISNPVNSTVPIIAETLKRMGTYDKNRLFGVTTLDVVRAATFVAENQKMPSDRMTVRVIGGHAGITILPLLSQLSGCEFSQQDKEQLTKRIMYGGDEVVQAKDGGGSATLSMAYAGAVFTDRVLRALNGQRGIIECTYVDSNITDAAFFSSPVELGTKGIEKIHGFGDLDAYEQKLFDEMMPELDESIAKGVEFVKENFDN